MQILAIDFLNDFLDSVGLGGPFGSVFFVVMLMIFVTLVASILRASITEIIMLNFLLLIISSLLGFIPAWTLIGVAMMLMVLIYIVISDIPIGGGGGQ